ncbi:MAG: hypothetical protein AAFV43_08850 [Planctomycetota bacterium]
MRFLTNNPRVSTPRSPKRPAGTSGLKLVSLACGLLLVLAAQQRLNSEEARRAIGALMADPAEAAITGFVATPASLGQPVITNDLLATIDDNAPFSDDEQAAWFACFQACEDDESEPAASDVTLSQLRAQPDVYRGRWVRVRGTVRRVEPVTPSTNDLGIDSLFRVVVQPRGGGAWPIMIYTRAKPPATTPFEAQATGLFFKNVSYRFADGVGVAPVVVAPEVIAGKPEPLTSVAPPKAAEPPIEFDLPAPSVGKAEGVSLGRAMLDQLGVSLESLDSVRDRARFVRADRAPFYAVLDAVGRTPATQLSRLAKTGLDDFVARLGSPADESVRARQVAREVLRRGEENAYSVAPLFDPAHSLHGELMVFDAVVRRAVWVEADETAPVRGYYELHAFPPDSQNLPLVFCMRRLPTGFPVGDSVRQPARLAGFFLKQWAYSTRRIDADNPGKDRRQFAPLFVGSAPQPLAAPSPADGRPGWLVGAAGGSLLGLTAVALLLAWRGDRRYEAATLARFRRLAAAPNDDADRADPGPDAN